MKVGRYLIALLLLAGAGFATVPLWISFFIFRPAPLADPDPARWQIHGAQLVGFRAEDGSRLAGWWLPPRGPAARVVLIAHGRSANISSRASIMRRLAADGFGVLAP